MQVKVLMKGTIFSHHTSEMISMGLNRSMKVDKIAGRKTCTCDYFWPLSRLEIFTRVRNWSFPSSQFRTPPDVKMY